MYPKTVEIFIKDEDIENILPLVISVAQADRYSPQATNKKADPIPEIQEKVIMRLLTIL